MSDWNWTIVDFLIENNYGEIFKQCYQIITETFDTKNLGRYIRFYTSRAAITFGYTKKKTPSNRLDIGESLFLYRVLR